MEKIHIPETKEQLSSLIKDVQEGKEVCLIECDKEVAILISIKEYESYRNYLAFKKLYELKQEAPLGDMSEIKELRDEGRK